MISPETKLIRKNILWTELKIILLQFSLNLQSVEDDDIYCVYANYIHTSFQSIIYKSIVPWAVVSAGYTQEQNNSNKLDFETNFKKDANKIVAEENPVTTRTEVDSLTLKLARISGQADENGDLVLRLDVPGSLGEIGRYIAGGYGITNNYLFGDAVTGVEVLDDVDGTYSGNPNAVLRTYHDDDVPAENRGWYFWKSHGTEGEIEVEPIGYYGELCGRMVLRITFKVQAAARVNCLLWWGSKE